MATNKDVLIAIGRLEAQMSDARDDIKGLSTYVMGNGAPENGLNQRTARIEADLAVIKQHISNKSIHGFGWWKPRYVAVLGGMVVSAIVLWFVLYALATANQTLLLEIIKAIT